jgi:hypothetical protein
VFIGSPDGHHVCMSVDLPDLPDVPLGVGPAARTRLETDSLGEVEVPADRYWGAGALLDR